MLDIKCDVTFNIGLFRKVSTSLLRSFKTQFTFRMYSLIFEIYYLFITLYHNSFEDDVQWRHQKCFCEGGGQNLPKIADFCHFFLTWEGQGGQRLRRGGGGDAPMRPPPPLVPPLMMYNSTYLYLTYYES